MLKEILQQHLEEGIYKHSLAVQACMEGIYEYLHNNHQLKEEDLSKEEWLQAGLLHDVDYVGELKKEHPAHTEEVLKSLNIVVSDNVIRVIKAHAPELTNIQPINKAEWALFCCDSLTGLITAVAYVYPSKKLADVKVGSVSKRFHKEPRFAAGTRRNEIILCEKQDSLNMPLDRLIEICLTSMQNISDELGL